MWVWIKELPTTTHPIFTARIVPTAASNNPPPTAATARTPHARMNGNTPPAVGRTMVTLSLRGDGKLEVGTSANREVGVFRKSNVHKMRWTHVALVHYPTRSSNPAIREFSFCILSTTNLIQSKSFKFNSTDDNFFG
jgi:hypothetical protein